MSQTVSAFEPHYPPVLPRAHTTITCAHHAECTGLRNPGSWGTTGSQKAQRFAPRGRLARSDLDHTSATSSAPSAGNRINWLPTHTVYVQNPREFHRRA